MKPLGFMIEITQILYILFADTDKYIFSDSEMEQRHNFTFRSLLQKPVRQHLFKVCS
jgi:hypothetical protein